MWSIDIKKARKEHMRKQMEKERFTKESKKLHKNVQLRNKPNPEMRCDLLCCQNIVVNQSDNLGESLWYIGSELGKIKLKQLYIADKFDDFENYCKIKIGINLTIANNLIILASLLTKDLAARYGYKLLVLITIGDRTKLENKIKKMIEINR